MEWHFGVLAIAAMGIYSHWAMVLCLVCVLYTAFYCAVCALSADIQNVAAVDGPPTLTRRLKWRATLAWFNFIEPLARDWGRLKGGLTPWRSVVFGSPTAAGARISRWWQRLQPFRRRVLWTHGGGPALDRTPFLEQLTTTLRLRNCAVGWNSDAQPWDLKVRRGVLGEAQVHMVVEHHGGAKRLARLSAILRPTRSLHSVQMSAAGCVAASAISQQPAGLLVSAAILALAWVAPIVEANRLEAVIQGASEDVARELNDAKDGR